MTGILIRSVGWLAIGMGLGWSVQSAWATTCQDAELEYARLKRLEFVAEDEQDSALEAVRWDDYAALSGKLTMYQVGAAPTANDWGFVNFSEASCE